MNNNSMTEGNILKSFFFFALPLFFASLFQQLYNTVDLIFVGNFLGKNSAGAVGASSILVTCIIGLLTGFSLGASVTASHYFGARKKDELESTIVTALIATSTLSICLTISGIFFSQEILILLNVPVSFLAEAEIYIRIYFLALLPMTIFNVSAGILRALGNSQTPFLVLALGSVLNILMNIIFVAILPLGVAGAAIATLFSQSFTAILLLSFIHKKFPTLKKDTFAKYIFYRIYKIGFPLGIQTMIITFSNIIIQSFINALGENSILAFAIYFKVESIIYLPILALGQAMITFTGQNLGAGKHQRIQKAIVYCNIFSAIAIFALSCFCLYFGEQILGIFCNDPKVIKEGMNIIRITFPLYFIYSILEITSGVLKGMEKTTQSMFIIIATLCIFRICLLLSLPAEAINLASIAAIYPTTWLAAAICFIIYYLYQTNSKHSFR